MSTLCSAAILRTTGDERVWRSSSGVMSARGFSGAAGGAGCGRELPAGAGDALADAGGGVAGGAALGGVDGAGALGAGADHVGLEVAGGANAAVEAGLDGAGVAGARAAGEGAAGVEVPALAAGVPSACAAATDWLVG
jgi:hypothetical protein